MCQEQRADPRALLSSAWLADLPAAPAVHEPEVRKPDGDPLVELANFHMSHNENPGKWRLVDDPNQKWLRPPCCVLTIFEPGFDYDAHVTLTPDEFLPLPFVDSRVLFRFWVTCGGFSPLERGQTPPISISSG